MRKVDRHAVAIKFAYDVLPVTSETAVARFETTGSNKVLIHVGELDNTHTEPLEDFNIRELIFDRRSVLESVDYPNPILLFCCSNVVDSVDRPRQMVMLVEHLLAHGDVPYCLLAVFIDRHGHTDRGQPGCPHSLQTTWRQHADIDAIDKNGLAMKLLSIDATGAHLRPSRHGSRIGHGRDVSTGLRSRPVWALFLRSRRRVTRDEV
jgi:hypothetical protein